MSYSTVIRNATIVNEGQKFIGDLSIENNFISNVKQGSINGTFDKEIDATGRILIPGMIDDQVHFREPGLTQKATIYTESRAAISGGITSFMEMPNTIPNTTTQKELKNKFDIASKDSLANYSFYMGATNDNLKEVLKTDPKNTCGIKIFMGSSTGNMLVDNSDTLSQIFKNSPILIATHCEDEATIRINTAKHIEKYGNDIPFELHPIIRSEEACFLSSSKAIDLAKKYDTRLHILHISTEKELALFKSNLSLKDKLITAECCIHHMWFNDSHYAKKGSFIKWNPAVKKESDRVAIVKALKDNTIDVIATDHAPHTFDEKKQNYTKAPSGGPLVQHALLALMELVARGEISIEKMVEKTSHAVSDCFNIEKRGFLKEGYFADLVLIDPNKSHTVDKKNINYKCGWSPFEGDRFNSTIQSTFVNGNMVYNNNQFIENHMGMALTFQR
ncbi:MAG: dihydroorotase [Crocinitomicaceae bacterium]|nr:dihydroorotase [Crocinitomicaceae bacterium]